MSVFDRCLNRYTNAREEEMTVQEYLELCKRDSSAYASVAERMLMAIGEPEVIDTHLTDRNSRIFANKMIRIYPAFQGFLRHGGGHRGDRRLLPPRRPGPGGEEADPLPARAGGGRQVLPGGEC